jgi:hypothetical protein
MAKIGRPSKLTSLVKQNFLSALVTGCHIEAACGFAGIEYATMREWVQRGEGTHPTRRNAQEYAEFAESVTHAIAQAEVALVKRVNDASKDDWRAATWMLERRHPERWANTQRIQIEVQKELERTLDQLEKQLPAGIFDQVLSAIADGDGGEEETSSTTGAQEGVQ